MSDLDVLVGQTIEKINVGDDQVDIYTFQGGHYRLTHIQDCCESVYVEDVEGKPDDLVGAEVLEFVAPSSDDDEHITRRALFDIDDKYAGSESFTWTFYRMDTDKGGLVIRFVGESNGYYSEEVDFVVINSPT